MESLLDCCDTDNNGILGCNEYSHPGYFHCYECGHVPPKHELVMQKGECIVCHGRKCNSHGGESWSLQDPKCVDCKAFGKE